MSRIRTIYQVQNVNLGPSPSTGFHFIDPDGTLRNIDSSGLLNLIQPMPRVQNISYSINEARTEVKQLGKRSTLARPIITQPTVNLDITYLQNGIFTESNLGFYTNYNEINGPRSGQPHYSNNFGVFLLSGFTTRSTTRQSNGLNWPYYMNDCRNIFIGQEEEGRDINLSSYSNFHPRAANIPVIGFGNCYLTRYQSQASVGNFPQCNVSFVCENMVVYPSGYRMPLPALLPESGGTIPTQTFSLPSSFIGDGIVSVIVPGNITLDITQLPKQSNVLAIQGTGITGGLYSSIIDLGTSFSDIKIQSYNLDLNIPRRALETLGYKLPLDREVIFPVYANLGVEMIVGDLMTGRLDSLVNRDDDYFVTIKLRNPANNRYRGNAVQYDLKGAKFQDIQYRNQIGGQQTASLNFTVELDDRDLTKGMFWSGLLNVDSSTGIYAVMGL